MLAIEFAVAGREHVRRRRRRPGIAKTVDRAAFKIDASKQRRRYALLALAQQSPRLLRTLDIPREQNHSRRLQPREQGS